LARSPPPNVARTRIDSLRPPLGLCFGLVSGRLASSSLSTRPVLSTYSSVPTWCFSLVFFPASVIARAGPISKRLLCSHHRRNVYSTWSKQVTSRQLCVAMSTRRHQLVMTTKHDCVSGAPPNSRIPSKRDPLFDLYASALERCVLS